jgi:hypothetical protein
VARTNILAVAHSIPEPGGAVEPDAIFISSESLIAVGDRGSTRLFNADGSFVGLRDGRPIGFLQDGSLVTSGGLAPLNVYDIAKLPEVKRLLEKSDLI